MEYEELKEGQEYILNEDIVDTCTPTCTLKGWRAGTKVILLHRRCHASKARVILPDGVDWGVEWSCLSEPTEETRQE